jgi:thiamine pyrophosphate-dependent acetolactate synthase large subunit-like protein
VTATLGPGAINMQLGVADATTNSTPMDAMFAPDPLVRRGADRTGDPGDVPQDLSSWPRPNDRRGLPSDPERAL